MADRGGQRYLITTADERTWKFDRPVLFLGEWCRRYNRRHVWEGMDAVVAAPYGVDPEQRIGDLRRVGDLIRRIHPHVSTALNAVHGTQHSERYWQIVLGHWLWRAVSALFNRYQVIDQALTGYDVAGTTVFDAAAVPLAAPDSLAFIYWADRDLWNHVLYSRLIADRGGVHLEHVELPETVVSPSTPPAVPAGRAAVVSAAVDGVTRFSRRFARDSDAVIVSSYLSARSEIALQAALGQVPQLWRTPSFERVPRDAAMRARLALDEPAWVGVDRFVLQTLPELLPTCYLEGYAELCRVAERLPWPRSPEFIFTSNSFDTDEVFKVWAAQKVDGGTPYFTGQHGANYGTRAGTEYWPERTTPDAFITWGWQDDDGISVPAFIFRPIRRKDGDHDPEGGLLLVEDRLYHMCYPSDRYYDYGLYQEEQFTFVERLPAHIQPHLTVRLHGGFRRVPWYDDDRWRDRSPATHIDYGAQPISSLLARSRLVMHSYDSTGLLETLAADIPTMCFWRGPLDHLAPAARPYYELLRTAGILLDTPVEAADAVASRWHDCEGWWQDRKVQEARRAFCLRYARPGRRRIRTLKALLRDRSASARTMRGREGARRDR